MTPSCLDSDSPRPPGLCSGCPSPFKALSHLPHQVKRYLYLEFPLQSLPALLSPPVPLQSHLEICTFLVAGLFVWSFCSSQHWAGALSLLCCSSCSRASGAPSTLPGTAWLEYEVWGLLLGHEATSVMKTQHHICGGVLRFVFLVCLDKSSF